MNKIKKFMDVRFEKHKQKWDTVMVICGNVGCLAGDTLIQVNRAGLSRKHTIKKMYNWFNDNIENIPNFHRNMFKKEIPTYVRSFNGKQIKLHKIKDVVYSGKKQTYLLELDNGKSIKATSNHKILTRKGWKELGKLNDKDEVMCDNLHTSKSNRKRVKLVDASLTTEYHPYSAYNKKRIEVHRLIYEANLNKMSLVEFLDILLNEPERAKELKYINPNKYHIHHKDGNHYNNSIENLEKIDAREHLRYHGLNGFYSNFSQGCPIFSKVKKITKKEIEDVYDIRCEDPHHNFVANGMVVHNSGKSNLGLNMLDYWMTLLNGKCEPEDAKHMCLTKEMWAEDISDSSPNEMCIFDEAGEISSRRTMTKFNTDLSIAYQIIRADTIFTILILPDVKYLDSYFRNSRVKYIAYVYKRGKFKFWLQKPTRRLMAANERSLIFDYDAVPASFQDSFPEYKGVMSEKYNDIKIEKTTAHRRKIKEMVLGDPKEELKNLKKSGIPSTVHPVYRAKICWWHLREKYGREVADRYSYKSITELDVWEEEYIKIKEEI